MKCNDCDTYPCVCVDMGQLEAQAAFYDHAAKNEDRTEYLTCYHDGVQWVIRPLDEMPKFVTETEAIEWISQHPEWVVK